MNVVAPARPRTWVRERLRVPLYRNGYALVASSGLTSGLGLVYWLIAARYYSPAAVGVSAGLISSMTLLANIAQLNLKSALNRFLPRAGAASADFVRRCYLIAVGAAAVTALGFIAGLDLWAPKLAFLQSRPELALWFVVATMAWTIFVLQDSVLAGIRQAPWMVAENLVYAIAKIALLAGVVALAPTLGAFAAWSAPLLALVIPVNLLLFRRLIPRHERATRERHEPLVASRVRRYVAADYLAYLISAGTIGALPLIVLGVLGAAANAYWFVSWSIAYSLYLISSGMGMSLLAEASLDPAELTTHVRRAIAETARLVLPAVAIVVIAAPELLGLLGASYERESTATLRLLALSAVPWMVVVSYLSVARVQRRMRAVVLTEMALCGLVLALSVALIGPLGIEGLAIAWLVAQCVVSVAVTAARWRDRAARAITAALRRSAPDRSDWTLQGRLATVNEVTVRAVGPAGEPPAAVLKIGRGEGGERAVLHEEEVLRELGGHRGLERWLTLLPRPLAAGRVRGRPYEVESHVAGVPLDEFIGDGVARERALLAVQSAIRPLHEATRAVERVGERHLEQWVERPLRSLRPLVARRHGVERADQVLEALSSELRSRLAGRRLVTARIHGDLCPDNLLMAADGLTVEGIVDWEQSAQPALPEVDLLHLLVTVRMAAEGRELGDVVAEMLRNPSLAEDVKARILLTWLHHVSANLAKAGRYARSPLWARRNVEPVLSAAGVLPLPAPARGTAVARMVARAVPVELVSTVTALALAVALWVGALGRIDPRSMTDIGLVSVLPAGFVAALGLLTVSFAFVVYRRPGRSSLLAAHLVALVAVLHATPSILYGTLRYSWAWKHVGIVDYIQRHGGVKPSITELGVYHNWPGFFGVDTLLTELAGVPNAIGHAIWGPVFFNLIDLVALVFLFRGLTRDRRVVWVACWLFVVASWVGQDYFSPQAFAFFLYVVMLGVVVRWLDPTAGSSSLPARRRAFAACLLLAAAIAVTHPLTAVMVPLALAALTLGWVCTARSLPFLAGALTVAWDLTLAGDFTRPQAEATLDSVDFPWNTTHSSLAAVGSLSHGQAVVATLSRVLVVVVVLVAAAGVVRALRRRTFVPAAVLIALAPVALYATGDYDGEILFRIYLFALPGLAFLAAQAVAGAGARGWRSGVAFATVAALIGGLFLFAYYGKDRQYAFTRDEVAAARWVYSHAPPHTLLVEGTPNYPSRFEHYERFTYVPIAREPASSVKRIRANPAGVLSSWLDDRSYRAAYLIITRSQKADADETGAMPRGSLDAIERRLLASPRFRTVYLNRDAAVFAPAGSRP